MKTSRKRELLVAVMAGVMVSWLGVSGFAAEAAEAAEGTKGWESSAGLGFALAKGNSDTLLFTANAQSSRKWPQDEVLLGASVAYGESDGIKNVENYQLNAQYNHLFTERLYGGLRFDAIKDDIADLDYRFTLSPLVGYYFIKKPNTLLSVEAGPSGVFEKQGGRDKAYIAMRIGERFEHKFSDKAKIWQSAEYIPQLDDFNNYLIIAEIGAEAALTKSLSLRAVVQDYYDNQPAPDRKKNDVKLITSINYKF